VVAFVVLLATDKRMLNRFLRVLLGKEKSQSGYEFDFIAAPNIVLVNVTLTDVDGLMEADGITDSADIIWRYSDMKREVIEKKVKPDVVDELLDSLTGDDGKENESQAGDDSEDGSPKVVKSHTVFIKREKNLDEGYADYVDPAGDHSKIPDDWDFVAGLENQDQGVDADLSGIGEDQEL